MVIINNYIKYTDNKIIIVTRFEKSYVASMHNYKYYANVTGFGKTDHNVTFDILRNTDLKY